MKVDFRTKRATRGSRPPFGNQISSFRSCFEVKIEVTNFAFPALSSPKESQFQIWNKECWERWSAKNVARKTSERNAPQEDVDHHLGTRFRVFGRVLKWISRRPNLHFQLYLHQKNLNFKSETRNDESVEVRRMLQGRLQNETRHKRKSTNIWEPDFEFSVVFWSENRGDQLCISSSIFTKQISISNLKWGTLRAWRCEAFCKVDFRTKRTTKGSRQQFGNRVVGVACIVCFCVSSAITRALCPILHHKDVSDAKVLFTL